MVSTTVAFHAKHFSVKEQAQDHRNAFRHPLSTPLVSWLKEYTLVLAHAKWGHSTVYGKLTSRRGVLKKCLEQDRLW